MFVTASGSVDVGLAEVESRLLNIRRNMEEWADVAYRRGEKLSTKVGPSPGVAKEVRLEIGMPQILRSGIAYPVKWYAPGATLLFPELVGDLVLSKQGTSSTQLTLNGTYEPPLGFVGRVADRAGLHNIADATVRHWLDQLIEALSTIESESE